MKTADGPEPCDTCDTMLTNANPTERSASQLRFLAAYREDPVVRRAARLAHVHRATVYRWMKDASFVTAMREAADAFFVAHRAKVDAEERERRQWRRERERARNPMRRYYLARARRQMPDGDWFPPGETRR